MADTFKGYLLPLFEFIERKSEKQFFASNPSYDVIQSEKCIAVARVIFALIMINRASFLYETEPLFGLSSPLLSWPLLLGFLYALMLFGFCLPIVAGSILVLEILNPVYIAVRMNVVVPYLFFVLSGTSCFSIDSLLKNKFPSYQKFLKNFSLPASSFPRLRFYFFSPFVILSLLATFNHLFDSSWTSLSVNAEILKIPLATTLPVDWIMHILESKYFLAVLSFGVFVQLFWEATMGLLYFNKYLLHFVIIYGFLFALASCIFLNLSFLGYMELIYWFIIFHPEVLSYSRRKAL